MSHPSRCVDHYYNVAQIRGDGAELKQLLAAAGNGFDRIFVAIRSFRTHQ